jgi:hypothetical protein
MKHLKTLGLVICAVGALTAFAGASSATAAEFHASPGTVGTAITGEQSIAHKLTVTGSSATCTTVKFAGKIEALTSTTLKLHPDYSGCTAFGFVGATIDTTGCQYLFHASTGTIDLQSCTSGEILVTASSIFGKCVVEIPHQTGINGQTFATGGGAPSRDLLIASNANDIQTNVVTSTGICPLAVGTHVNATYTGTTTVKSTSDEIYYT